MIGPTLLRILVASVAAVAVGSSLAGDPPSRGGTRADAGRVLARRVERTAADIARVRIAPPDRFEVLASRFGGADPVEDPRVGLEPIETKGPNASGVVRVRFRMLRDGAPCGEARASVRGVVRGPGLVAARTLPVGEAIAADAVRVEDRDLTRLLEPPLRDPVEVTDRVPIRTLGRNRLLTPALLAPAPVVRRGDDVDLRYESGRVFVRADGLARRDGAPGEVIPAENKATGAVVLGEVQPDGSLLVVRGPHAGR